MTALAGFLLLGIVIGLARGGSIGALGRARLRAAWLLAIAFVLQLLANMPSGWLGFVFVVASFVAVLAFAGLNARMAGMPIVALGAALNAIVIAVNQGMPVSAEAIAAVGEDPASLVLRGKHFVDLGGAHLRFLSDVIAWDLRPAIVSIGDLILWGGVSLLVAELMVERSGARAEAPAR